MESIKSLILKLLFEAKRHEFYYQLTLFWKKILGFLHRELDFGINTLQVRHGYVDKRMYKDHKRRIEVEKYGKERLRLNSLRKNRVLPQELQSLADEEIAALPKLSCPTSLVSRCVVTSRPKGVVNPYGLSRIIFRHLADYNFLAGWQRARW